MDTQDNNQIVETQEEAIADVSEEVMNVQDESSSEDTTPQEEFDIIKYNKEEVKIPASERQTYLQKGYNYDKVQQQLEQAKQQAAYLDRIAKRQGFENPQDFITAFEEMENQRRIEEEAQRLGMDAEVFKEYLEPMRSELERLKQEREEIQKAESERQLDAEILRLKSVHPDFEQVQDKVFDIAINKGYELEDAYILATYQDKAKQIEQQTLAKVANRDQRQVLSSIDKPGQQIFDVNNLTSAQLKEISQRVQRGERITF
jgi:predicted nucleic acid-binding protein